MPDPESPLARPSAPAASQGPAEALAVCRVCHEGVTPAGYEEHLRRAHGLYAYRGVHAARADTLDLVLDDLLALRPTDVAWQALARLARADDPADPEKAACDLFVPGLARIDRALQVPICRALAALIAPAAADVLLALATRPEPVARVVALFGLVDPAMRDRRGLRAARELFADDTLSSEVRCQALAALVARLAEPGQATEQLLKLAAKMGKTRTLELFAQLEQRLGPHHAIAEVRSQLENRIRMSCPRCAVELRQPLMQVHLWHEHRLLLDGLRVRDPWVIVEEWLDSARASHDLELISRARIAADKLDPAGGQKRVARLLVARGLADERAKQELLDEAAARGASCCPHCFAFVNVPGEDGPLRVRYKPGRLEASGYDVTLTEAGLRPMLRVRTPAGVIRDGVEPGRSLTANGAAFLAGGAVVAIALLFACVWPRALGGPLRPVAVLLAVAALLHALVRVGMRPGTPLRERVLGYAWQMLVPRLHAGGFVPADSAFVAGLALMGSDAIEDGSLGEMIRMATAALDRGEVPASHLAPLLRLQVERAVSEDGADPVSLVVRHLTRCFGGKRSMLLAQHLLDDWKSPWWSKGNLARLRILLCDQAFEAGFEVATLLDAGRLAPALGVVLGTDSPRSLAALRLLWSQRPTRPWDRLGEVKTAFELAGSAHHSEVLSQHPDVLLWQILPDTLIGSRDETPVAATILFTLRGVWLQEELFMIPPRVVEVRRRSGGDTEMLLGRATFHSPGDLDPLSRQLERWFRWVFHDFVPQIDRVLTWPAPDRAALLRAWSAVPCPGCGKPMLPVVGEVGIAAS
jgi:hypothetical protein